MSGRLLLVDDDRFILNPLSRLLGQHGFHCTLAVTAAEAFRLLDSEQFDLMLLDIGLPDIDGVTVCRRVRTRHKFPIIMVTARDAALDKILGLEIGADDYITKPFDPSEIVARVRAHLRRVREYSTQHDPEPLAIGDLKIDADIRDAIAGGKPCGLTNREFDLVSLLARNAGRSLASDWIFEQVWGYDAELGIKALAVCVRRVRCKIERDPDNPAYLQTVRGFGYRFATSTD